MNRFDLDTLNAEIRRDPVDFIAQCDERYNLMILDTAAQIARNIRKSPIVLLAGPSGSGKTTSALRIRAALEARGIGSYSISLDDYYLSTDAAGYPMTEDGQPDLESPLGLDIPLLREHLNSLASGSEIEVPFFNFKLHRRDPSGARRLRLRQDEVVVIEGLHALNPLFTDRHPDAFGIYISAATDLYDHSSLLLHHDAFRLLRRCIRDLYHRNAPAEETLGLWHNICRGESLYITPYMDLADMRLNTSLGYELPVLTKVAEPQFYGLTDDAPEMDLVLRIQRAADRMEPIDPSLVPRASLLKAEFML